MEAGTLVKANGKYILPAGLVADRRDKARFTVGFLREALLLAFFYVTVRPYVTAEIMSHCMRSGARTTDRRVVEVVMGLLSIGGSRRPSSIADVPPTPATHSICKVLIQCRPEKQCIRRATYLKHTYTVRYTTK